MKESRYYKGSGALDYISKARKMPCLKAGVWIALKNEGY